MQDEHEQHLDRLRTKAEAYRKTFLGEDGKPQPYAKIVLDDLAVYCGEIREGLHLNQAGAVDPYATIYRIGRADVLKRLKYWFKWTEDGTHGRECNIDFDSPERGRGRELIGGGKPAGRWERFLARWR